VPVDLLLEFADLRWRDANFQRIQVVGVPLHHGSPMGQIQSLIVITRDTFFDMR
jgi:hypothetical protein